MRKISLIVVACALSACATTRPYFDRDGIGLIPTTVNWYPSGLNYKIKGMVQDAAGTRVETSTYVTDCKAGYGHLSTQPFQFEGNADALLNGPTNKDRIFTQLCDERTIKQIRTYDATLTPEQKQELRNSVAAAGALLTGALLSQPIPAPSAPESSPRRTTTECENVPGAVNGMIRCKTK